MPHKSPERNVHVHIIIMNRTVKKKVKNSPIYLLTFCVENYVWMDVVLHPPTKGSKIIINFQKNKHASFHRKIMMQQGLPFYTSILALLYISFFREINLTKILVKMISRKI